MRRCPLLLILSTIILLMLQITAASAMTRSEAMRELGLSRNNRFTPKELKAAYRKRSLETHPDKGGSADEFVKVAEAYEELLVSGGGEGGGGAAGERKFRHRRAGGGGMSEEEMADQMKRAEDMFFDMFDDLFDEDTVGDAVDNLFAQFSGGGKQGYGMKMVKAFVKWVAPKLMKLLENEGTTISINGQSMSGPEFKEWRERKRQARQGGRIAEKDL